MHLFVVAFFVAGTLYAIFQQQLLILYFLLTVGIYFALSVFLPGGKTLSNRKKIMVATWQNPSEGVIHVRMACRAQKIQELIKNNKSEDKITMTHFVIKAAGQIIASSTELNGKLAFGKFYPHDSADISCLVDIEGGKDLALILVNQADKKSVREIAQFIRQKGSKIKKGKGDADHKKRTKSADFMPAFMVKVMIELARFCTNKLGISVPFLGLKRHQFGAACVTSLGMLNFVDATAPFTGFTDCVTLISANAVHDQPVIQDGKIVPGRVINCNLVVDHRFIDGGRAKSVVKVFQHVFNHPEKYLDQSGPKIWEHKKQV